MNWICRGRVRNNSEAALQSYFASAASRDATHLSLVSTIAKAYFNELVASANMELADRTLNSYEETYRLMQLRHRAGVISALELRQQESLIESAKSSYAGAVRSREQARNQLELLISQKLPEDLPAPLPLAQQFKIHDLPAGLPSDLLLNRPDIIAAEHNLKQANANIGAARAAFFPRISLTSSVGLGSNQLSNLFESANKSWSFGGSLSVPIFDWGNNSANLDAAKIAQQKNCGGIRSGGGICIPRCCRCFGGACSVYQPISIQLGAKQSPKRAFAFDPFALQTRCI